MASAWIRLLNWQKNWHFQAISHWALSIRWLTTSYRKKMLTKWKKSRANVMKNWRYLFSFFVKYLLQLCTCLFEIRSTLFCFQNILGNDGVLIYHNMTRTAPFHYALLLNVTDFSYWSIFNVLHVPATQVWIAKSSQLFYELNSNFLQNFSSFHRFHLVWMKRSCHWAFKWLQQGIVIVIVWLWLRN